MNPQLSYYKQFVADRENSAEPSGGGAVDNYERDFLAANGPKPAQPENESLQTEIQEKSPKQNKEFLWMNNSLRFAREDMPFLSGKSVKQLEANYRELMMIEANIKALGGEGNKFYITSCVDRDGKTITSISIAYALSFYSGQNVLLIDFNPQNPQIHNLFGISETPGFYELCAGTASMKNVILPTVHKGLSVVTIGSVQSYMPGEEEIRRILDELSLHFDYLICDGSSVMTSSVALRNIRLFDAALIVLECEKTRWEVLQIAEDKIKKSGGPSSIGVVYNRRKYYIPSIVYKVISKN